MSVHTQKLSIRLLRKGLAPGDSLRDGVDLKEWPKLESALIALDTLGGNSPRWTRFLELSDEDKRSIFNTTAYGLVFVNTSDRWFAVAFGMGHVKLNLASFEQDFGLRAVLNAVDPKQFKSADVRTPDENTLSRRSQTSRGSDQTAFAINVERDIVRGLAGAPKDKAFASRVAGTDALSMDGKLEVADLAAACAQAYTVYQKTDYKAEFGWIDHIRHIRDQTLIDNLDAKLVEALAKAVKEGTADSINLAFPIIYDPERTNLLRDRGFRSSKRYGDLDISGYLDALEECGKTAYGKDDLASHTVHEVDDQGRDCGGKWKIRECVVFETELESATHVLLGGPWYKIDRELAKDVRGFFENAPRTELPDAEAHETEETYNKRVAELDADMICLDRKLIKPTGATTKIEACDFLGRKRHLIHVKDKTSSSRLSHLFSQGTVSARVLAVDPPSRDSVCMEVEKVQAETGQMGYETILPKSNENFQRADFTVVYAVIARKDEPQLPFFSLVSFRQAARELEALGYKYAFAWIGKPKTASKGKAKRIPMGKAAVPEAAE